MYTRNFCRDKMLLNEPELPYSAKFWQSKTLANRSFQSFGEENIGKFTAIYSHFSESGIWLGKILANDVPFAKFAKVFPHQNFALYGNWSGE